jgi:hypothetical protein
MTNRTRRMNLAMEVVVQTRIGTTTRKTETSRKVRQKIRKETSLKKTMILKGARTSKLRVGSKLIRTSN